MSSIVYKLPVATKTEPCRSYRRGNLHRNRLDFQFFHLIVKNSTEKMYPHNTIPIQISYFLM